jgi:glutathione S-transferase
MHHPELPAGKMLLHWSPRSPFVRKVMIVASELGLKDRLHCVRTVVGGTIIHQELMHENPLGKLPTLVLEDGRVIYDSHVICDYLDTLHDGPKLFPTDPAARIEALRRHALGDGMLDTGLAWLGERARPAERQSPDHIAMWRAKLQACVDHLEGEAEALAAAPFGIGHIGIGTALGYLDFRFGTENFRARHPRIGAWLEAFNTRPAVIANLPADDS